MPNTNKVKKGSIYILSLLIIAMSVYFYYYLTNIDETYSKIITREEFLFNNIQNITFGSNKGYLLLFKIMETNNPIRRDSLLTQRKLLVSINDSLINEILFNKSEYSDKSFLNKVIEAREDYQDNIGMFLDHLYNNKDSVASILVNKIEPSYLKYQQEIKLFIESNNYNVLKNSGKISSDVKRKSLFVLFLGFSPIIVFTSFLILLGIFMVVMLLFIKDVERDR
jgi:hypothetical protein